MKLYIVRLDIGSWDDHRIVNMFVTKDLVYAKKYVDDFNSRLNKWKDYYRTLSDDCDCWVKEEYEHRYRRWDKIMETNKCLFEEIEVRE